MSQHYLVTWEVDVWTDTPEQAARQALAMQLADDRTFTSVFYVEDDLNTGKTIDVTELDAGGVECE